MTLQAAIDDLIAAFSQAGEEYPQVEARQLVQECLSITFAQIMSHPEREIEPAKESVLKNWKEQRLAGVPLAYLSKHRGFYKYDFIVEPGVLVPRPESELIVETALRRIEDRQTPAFTAADLGSGSGCIGLSLVSELSEVRLWAVDSSATACAIAQRNAVQLGVQERVKVENRRVEEWDPGMHFDLIVANPPYIAENDPLVQPSVRRYEPPEALFSGEDGLEALRQWSAWALRHLQIKGIFVCEFGAGQGRVVQDLFAKTGFDSIQIERDLAGHERVISAIRTR